MPSKSLSNQQSTSHDSNNLIIDESNQSEEPEPEYHNLRVEEAGEFCANCKSKLIYSDDDDSESEDQFYTCLECAFNTCFDCAYEVLDPRYVCKDFYCSICSKTNDILYYAHGQHALREIVKVGEDDNGDLVFNCKWSEVYRCQDRTSGSWSFIIEEETIYDSEHWQKRMHLTKYAKEVNKFIDSIVESRKYQHLKLPEICGAVTYEDDYNTKNWVEINIIIKNANIFIKDKSIQCLEYKEDMEIESKKIYLFNSNCHVYVLALIDGNLLVADGANTSKLIIDKLREKHQSLTIQIIETVGQRYVDHCASAAVCTAVKFAELLSNNKMVKTIQLRRSLMILLQKKFHSARSSKLKSPKTKLSCQFCRKIFNSKQNRHLVSHEKLCKNNKERVLLQ